MIRDVSSNELVYSVYNQATQTVVKAIALPNSHSIYHPILFSLQTDGSSSGSFFSHEVFGFLPGSTKTTAAANERQIEYIRYKRLSSDGASDEEEGDFSDCYSNFTLWTELMIESLHVAFMQQEADRYQYQFDSPSHMPVSHLKPQEEQDAK